MFSNFKTNRLDGSFQYGKKIAICGEKGNIF